MGLVGHKQGRFHGYEGFCSFSNEWTLQKNGRFSMFGLIFLPYSVDQKSYQTWGTIHLILG